MQRWQTATIFSILLISATAVSAQAPPAEAGEARGAQAILIRNPDPAPGAPPFALADQFGKVRRLVEPTPSLDLKQHVGQRVRIKHDTGSTLLASQLELPSRSAAREPRELKEVSPAQFVSPRLSKAVADPRAPDPEDRRYAVVPAQATDEAADRFRNFADDLPGPSDTTTPSTDPIQLDDLPAPSVRESLEPTPAANNYYEEIPLAEPIRSGHDHGGHAADCPHCNKQNQVPHSAPQGGCDCDRCRAKVAPPVNLCSTCGRSPGWCGPTCNPPSRRGLYGRAEYLLWWFNGMDTPPLATVNTSGNPPILGQNGTSIVFGGGDLLDGARSGMRFTVGAWLDDRRDMAVEFDWLRFETETDVFAASDPLATNTIGRPFYNVGPINQGVLLPPQDDVQIIPGGALAITARSRFQTAGLRLRTGICCRDIGGCGPCGCGDCVSGVTARRGSGGGISRVDFIAGYRFADLEEELLFQENGLTQGTAPASVSVSEGFQVDNDFHGVDLGFIYDWQTRRWGLELMSRIALGNTSQSVSIGGTNTVVVGAGGGNGITTAGGLLTQPSNIGVYERDRFSVLPELSARLSYRLTPRLSLSAAYTLLYWANVVRPGDQIDFTVDGRQSGGVAPTSAYAHPRVDIEETSLWAHGFNFGLDYQY